MKRIKRRKPISKSSLRHKLIEEALYYIREIKKIENGNRCDICGRHQDQLPFPLSSFHILRRSAHPRLVLYRPNILIACWTKNTYLPYCHNIWHHFDKRENRYIEVIKRIEIKIGLDLPIYEERLKIAEVTLPKLSLFNIENMRFVYKVEYERMKEAQCELK